MKLVRRLVAGLVVLLIIGAIGGVAYAKFGPKPQTTVTAYFPQTIGIYVDSQVRILGVPVGKVKKITPVGPDVRVVLSWDSRYKVPASAGAAIVPPTIVSDRYVQLTPAYTGGPTMASGAVIPLSRTEVPVELDQILGNLNTLSSALGPNGANKNGAFSQLIRVSAQNLSGNGQRLHDTLQAVSEALGTFSANSGNLFSTLNNLTAFTQTIDADNSGVLAVNNDLAQVSVQLNGERADLGNALHDLQIALGQVSSFVADNKTQLTSDLGGLTSITGTLVKEKTSLEEFLDDAPLALQNLSLTYDPKYHTLDTRSNEGANSSDLYCAIEEGLLQLPTCPLQPGTTPAAAATLTPSAAAPPQMATGSWQGLLLPSGSTAGSAP